MKALKDARTDPAVLKALESKRAPAKRDEQKASLMCDVAEFHRPDSQSPFESWTPLRNVTLTLKTRGGTVYHPSRVGDGKNRPDVYMFENLDGGVYELTAELPNFVTMVRKLELPNSTDIYLFMHKVPGLPPK
jgi:hypothetical protein